MRDSEWPLRFKIGLAVGLALCGSKIAFTLAGMYGAFRTIEDTGGQATPDMLAGSLGLARVGNLVFLGGLTVLLVTVIGGVWYRSVTRHAGQRAP